MWSNRTVRGSNCSLLKPNDKMIEVDKSYCVVFIRSRWVCLASLLNLWWELSLANPLPRSTAHHRMFVWDVRCFALLRQQETSKCSQPAVKRPDLIALSAMDRRLVQLSLVIHFYGPPCSFLWSPPDGYTKQIRVDFKICSIWLVGLLSGLLLWFVVSDGFLPPFNANPIISTQG